MTLKKSKEKKGRKEITKLYYKRSIYKDARKKDKIKIIRTIFEILFCIAIVIMVSKIIFFPKQYKKPDMAKWTQSEGFIAISYTGVSYKKTSDLISKNQLDNQLKALYNSGYVTLDIEDIENYYKNNGRLPPKALLLMFEDGRKDSFIFAQSILKKYNFKAVMFTYASNIEDNNRIFLKKKDLRYLDKNSFWECGSSGYRFSRINVYKKNAANSSKNGNDTDIQYTHYLMDYLRDENGIPIESKKQMEERITYDYDEMNKIYKDVLGYQPKVYMIMHAGSIFNNMNAAVQEINLKNIYKYFDIMFARKESSYNTKNDSIYNLTRLQVNPDWTGDMLISQIKKDIQEKR